MTSQNVQAVQAVQNVWNLGTFGTIGTVNFRQAETHFRRRRISLRLRLSLRKVLLAHRVGRCGAPG
jgi:hypothetical protein